MTDRTWRSRKRPFAGRQVADAEQHFRAIPEVDAVERAGEAVTVRGRGDLVTNVIRCIAEHRLAVSDFRTEVATLEDVFLRLTGHSIRS